MPTSSRSSRCREHPCYATPAGSGDRRREYAKAKVNLRRPIAQGANFRLWHVGMRKDSKTLVLAAFFGYFLSPKKESTHTHGKKKTDSHASDVGHWLRMTRQEVRPSGRTGPSAPTKRGKRCGGAGRRGRRPLRVRSKKCGDTGRCGHRPLRMHGKGCGA